MRKGVIMETRVSDMTVSQLEELINRSVVNKLREILNDDDFGREIKKSVKEQLNKQLQETSQGNIGTPLKDVLKELEV